MIETTQQQGNYRDDVVEMKFVGATIEDKTSDSGFEYTQVQFLMKTNNESGYEKNYTYFVPKEDAHEVQVRIFSNTLNHIGKVLVGSDFLTKLKAKIGDKALNKDYATAVVELCNEAKDKIVEVLKAFWPNEKVAYKIPDVLTLYNPTTKAKDPFKAEDLTFKHKKREDGTYLIQKIYINDTSQNSTFMKEVGSADFKLGSACAFYAEVAAKYVPKEEAAWESNTEGLPF